MSIAMSFTPVSALIYSAFVQVFPPSTVLNTPRSSLGPHKCPAAATYTMLGFVGWITILPMWCVSLRPMFCQVLPPSVDLCTPLPHDELCRLFDSPDPTQTV